MLNPKCILSKFLQIPSPGPQLHYLDIRWFFSQIGVNRYAIENPFQIWFIFFPSIIHSFYKHLVILPTMYKAIC